MNNSVNFFNYYNRIRDDDNVLFSYKGAVNDTVLMEMCEDIRQKLDIEEVYNRKLFSIFIELVQNQIYYAADNYLTNEHAKESVGLIILSANEGGFSFSTGNLIRENDLIKLKAKLEYLNNLPYDELRQFKREQRVDSAKNEKESGAGIGLIKSILTSGNPLLVDSIKIEDQIFFFTLTCVVSAVNND
ncbi:MAG: hypothetical protein EAZ85_07160 [Bacteroidetes bacterium]|nr:MAG: hypothetical protein EAZ85_07160 [Bacteroidota bacterium]TAG85517.1 MAG: hypothetical protein EAZ20_14905 [Bacteroidota bacterium]